MKKIVLILVVVFFATANVMAQEVHGVESKMVCTSNCNPDGSWERWENHFPRFGYEFTNRNSIPVSVEVELYEEKDVKFDGPYSRKEFVLVSTKSFVLESNESYIFKTSEDGIADYVRNKEYYVKYKAYKLQ